MSQLSVPWTDTSAEQSFSSNEQEQHTQVQFGDAFKQDNSDDPTFSSYNEDLDGYNFSLDNSTTSHSSSSDPSAVSTPDFSTYIFGQQSSGYQTSAQSTPHLYPHSGPGTPNHYSIEPQQTYHPHPQHPYHHRPLPFLAHTNSYDLPAHSPQGYDRRRSLSHSDVDRIAAPPHPTFIRLQNGHEPRPISVHPNDPCRGSRYGRSVSQGPGRPMKYAIPYAMPGSHLAFGTPLGAPLDSHRSRKRLRECEPLMYRMTDPTRLAHSRRIIEIGAMAVRNHADIDPALDNGMTAHERILKKVEDVEVYLRMEERDHEDALKGCAMIRAALLEMREKSKGLGGENVVKEAVDADVDVPSKMMASDGDDRLFGGCLDDDDDLMSLLTRENERMDEERDAK